MRVDGANLKFNKRSVDFLGSVFKKLLGLSYLSNSLRQQATRLDQSLLLSIEFLLYFLYQRFRNVEFSHPAEKQVFLVRWVESETERMVSRLYFRELSQER